MEKVVESSEIIDWARKELNIVDYPKVEERNLLHDYLYGSGYIKYNSFVKGYFPDEYFDPKAVELIGKESIEALIRKHTVFETVEEAEESFGGELRHFMSEEEGLLGGYLKSLDLKTLFKSDIESDDKGKIIVCKFLQKEGLLGKYSIIIDDY